jgi:hypothetical protein
MAAVITLLDQPRALTAQGKPTSAVIFFYLTGTTVLANIYNDEALTDPAANPVLLASGQIFPDIYLDPEITYRRRIVYGDGTIHDVDPLPSFDTNNIYFTQLGTNAITRTVQAELEETVKVTQYGGANDTAMINNALNANVGRTVTLPKRALPYVITSKINIPAGTTLLFEKGASVALGYNGAAFELLQESFIIYARIDGKGATYAASKGVIMDGANGKNGLIYPVIYDTGSFCIDFLTTTAGSDFVCIGANLARYGTAVIDGTSVVINMADGSLAAAATPRMFVSTSTNGWATCAFGGCNDVSFTGGGYHGPFIFSNYSRGIELTGIRWGNQTTCDIKGANISITGCGIGPALTITPSVGGSGQSIVITGNNMNSPRVVDNSGFPTTNVVQHRQVTEPCLLRADGTAVTVSEGNNRNNVYRNGAEYCMDIDIQGNWTGSIPGGFGSASSITFDVPADYMPTYETFVGPINMTYNGAQKAVFGRLFGTTTGAGNLIRLGYFNNTGDFVQYTGAALNAGPTTRIRGTFRWTR